MSIETFGTWLARHIDTPGPLGDLAAFCAGQCNCRGCTWRGMSVGPVVSVADVRAELNTHFGGGSLTNSPMHACLDLAVRQWRSEHAGHLVLDVELSCVECGSARLDWSGDGPRRVAVGVAGTRVVQVVRCGQCGHVWSVEITRDSRSGVMRLVVHP